MAERKDTSTLGVEVEGLKGDVYELKEGLIGLRQSFDETMARFITETRAAIEGLSTNMAAGRRTPWATLFAGLGVVMGILAAFGNQALTPLQSHIQDIKAQMVPRQEVEFRYSVNSNRLNAIEGDIRILNERAYSESRKEVENLQRELRALRGTKGE